MEGGKTLGTFSLFIYLFLRFFFSLHLATGEAADSGHGVKTANEINKMEIFD
jgi:hypothetical protein